MNHMLKAFKGLDYKTFVRAAEYIANKRIIGVSKADESLNGACIGIYDVVVEGHNPNDNVKYGYRYGRYSDGMKLWFQPAYPIRAFWAAFDYCHYLDVGQCITLLPARIQRERRIMMLLLCAELCKEANMKKKK